MKWAALIAWVVTAGGGFVLLAIWLSRGGMRQEGTPGTKIRPALILSHFLLAATGLRSWLRVPVWLSRRGCFSRLDDVRDLVPAAPARDA